MCAPDEARVGYGDAGKCLRFAVCGTLCSRALADCNPLGLACVHGGFPDGIICRIPSFGLLIQCSFCISAVSDPAGVFAGPLECSGVPIFYGIVQQVTRLIGMHRSFAGCVRSAQQQVSKAFRAQIYDRLRDIVAVFYTARLGNYI